MSFLINHPDLLKSLHPYKFSISHIKLENNNFLYSNNNYNLKNNNSLIEDAIKEIFPSENKDTNNKEKLVQHKLYEITNYTEALPKKDVSPKRNHKEKKNIFIFKKINKYIGRRRHNSQNIYKIEANHNKYKEDNMVNKIKIYFINSIMSFLNKKYFEFMGMESKKLLAKIKPNFTKVWTKKENQE